MTTPTSSQTRTARRPRAIGVALLGLALPTGSWGCSGGEAPPAAQPSANVAPNPAPAPKAGKAKPQAPGSVDYEDKPGGRARGR